MASWGFNFRNTAGYVTDGAGETYVVVADTYPKTRNGITFGYTSGTIQARDRSTSVDRRLAGAHWNESGGAAVFRVDLPASGEYNIRLAMGDTGASTGTITIKDGVTTVLAKSGVAIAGGSAMDATGTVSTYANWPANNTAVAVMMSGTTLTVEYDLNVSPRPIRHLYIEEAGAPPDTPPTAGFTVSNVEPSTETTGCIVTVVSAAVAGTNPITSTLYDWGDGSAADAGPTHEYGVDAGGQYTITQTVSDGLGGDDSHAELVITREGWEYRIDAPGMQAAYAEGFRYDA